MARIDSSSRPQSASTQPTTAKPDPASHKTAASAPKGWTPRRAAETAAEVLRGAKLATVSGRNSRVTRDAADVNDGAGRNPAASRHQKAQAMVAKLQPDETRQLTSLSPPAQSRYTAVLSAAGSKDPVLRLSMQELLLSGKLQQADSHGHSLLETLATLANPKTPLAAGLDRATLINELVQELATPSAIDQANRNTCGPTTVAIFAATTRPAEYARLVAGLASPAGMVDMVQGSLTREAGTTTEDGSRRSTVQRLLEPALMEFGNGALDYDNQADKHALLGLPVVPGALPSMVAKMLTGIMGRQAKSSLDLLGLVARQDVLALEHLTRAGTPVPVLTDYKKEGVPELHWLLATRVGPTEVSYVNPWGREETMSRAEFDRRLKGLALPPSAR